MANSHKHPDRSSSCTTKLLSLCIILIFLAAAAVSIVYLIIRTGKPTIGINYGRIASNLPPPAQAVEMIKQLKIGRVKIYDSNPEVLRALANSGLEVSIMVTNQELEGVGSSQAAADQWVQQNVVAWYKSVKIIMVVVGNEVLSDSTDQGLWTSLVPAMENIQASLLRFKLGSIMVTTSLAVDCLETSFPPSNGTFRKDITTSVIQPLLQFLSRTHAYFFVNVYPYFAWADNPTEIPLDYALFDSNGALVQDGGYHYTNLLDAQLDAVVSAMTRLGYQDVKLAISETGWPSHGDPNQPGANISVAAEYNRGLVRKAIWDPKGTPRRPGSYIPTYIFSLFNEDLKPGPTTERNWGLLYPNGSSVYDIDLTGRRKESEYVSSSQSLPFQLNLPSASTSLIPADSSSPSHLEGGQQSGAGGQWCVAKDSAESQILLKNLNYACSQADCIAIQPGKPCYSAISISKQASYAFNIYYQHAKATGGTCYFDGAAVLTSIDPSSGSCIYPLV
ncbi:hypothetical protein O6H91_21G067100 [Diphasiastrum complanatum]|uniref:Uncharacterized protein n=1 Tax=Diphasiastrum complanatum TaxID=34168 RepID=A0ACC2ALG6_DIPCM|nr:hypothetical protein O6H91_21G067100 [Diphasiastrum complanatum]